MRFEGLSRICSKLENLFFNKHLFAGECGGEAAAARPSELLCDEWTRSGGSGRSPCRRVNAVHRVSCEVARRVSPGGQLAQVPPGEPPAAGCCGVGVVQGEEASAAGANSNTLPVFEKVGVGTLRINAAQAQCAGQQTNGVAPL